MTKYVVGDIQGCFDSLEALLDKASFDPVKDTLYCVGDLINRGPKDLETLVFLSSLGESVKPVLGNHDLHFLSCYYGIREFRKSDTSKKIRKSDSAEELVHWLKQMPLMIYDESADVVISHAGLYPGWSLEQGLAFSKTFSSKLKSDKFMILLKKMYGNKPNKFSEKLSKKQRWLFTVNSFTRMRYCYNDMRLNFSKKGSPKEYKNVRPWFNLPNKRPKNTRFVFGHWSNLGLYEKDNIIGIDTGCVWGNKLTLYNIDDSVFIQQKAID
jgi:bis(5'-nucleosyl)-tetraphosphatase (symmetrical)